MPEIIYYGLMIISETEPLIAEQQGIEHLQHILSPEAGKNPTILLDLDDTIKELKPIPWPGGDVRRIYQDAVNALRTARDAGISLGVVTEQSFSEIEPFLSEVAYLAGQDPYVFFNGIIIGEGGTVVLNRTYDADPKPKPIYTDRYHEDRKSIVNWFEENMAAERDSEGWSTLSGVDPESGTLMQMPPVCEQGDVTVTIWEKGPNLGLNPAYDLRYAENRRIIAEALDAIGITGWDIFEAGNGTVRIVPKGRNKAHMVRMLSLVKGISLKDTIYFCDGPNDISLAKLIKSRDGGIVTVGNAVSELHEIADYSAQGHSGLGVAETINKILPRS